MIRADGGMGLGDARGPDQNALFSYIDPVTGQLVPGGQLDTMAYPERSPSQPVSRDDLAQTITLREMYKRLGVGPEAYTSSEDRGSYDPSIGDTMATGRESINPFSPDTTAFSTSDRTAADKAFGNFSGNSFGNVGALTPGAVTAAGNAIAQGRSAVATPAQDDTDTALTEGLGGKSDKGYVPGTYTPNFDWTFSQPFSPTVPSFPNGVPLPTARPAMPEDQPATPHITVHPGRYTPNAPLPGRPSAPGVPGESGVSTSAGSGPGSGFGGGIDMAATGGYEGSASVGNTTGAAGFTSPGGGSGFGNVGGSQGSYGSYAGSETTPGSYGGMGSTAGFSMTGGYDPSGYGGFGGLGGLGSGGESGGGAVGGFGGGGGGTDPGGSPGGVG